MDGSATNGGGGGGDNPSGKRKESGFVASIRQAWTGLQKMKKRKIDADGDGGTIQPSEQAGSTPPTSRKKRAFRTRTTEEQEEVTSASSTTSSSSSSTSSTSSSRSRTRQEVVAEARQSVTDKKRKLEALTAFLAAPATTPAKALDEPSPSAGKQKKKPKKPKKSKKQKLLHHSNTGSSNPSVDLLAAQLKTKDLRDFLLWLYAVQAKPSPAVFFSNPATLPTTVMVVIRSLGQAELIKHKGLLKNMLTTEEGGIFQKATAFNAPGSKYRVFETVATLILTDANLQKKMSTSQAKEVEKEVAVLLQEQYQELVSKLPDPTDRASLFEEFIATQEEMKASRFPIYKVSKREDWLTGSSNRPPPNLSLFVRLPKKMEKKEGVKRKHLPIVAIDCEMCLTEDGHELTRVSVIDDNYNVLYDQLVKPHKPITDYLTRWSGITEEMMTGVTTHLEDVHKAFHDLGITRKTIIAGHSVENDLLALRLFHKRVIDTTMHFPHANGPPFKNSLRYLTEKFLKRLIQQGHDGHCSVEDAKAVMELILLKVAQAGVHVSKSGDVEVSDKDDGENLFIKVRNANRKVTVIDRLVALQRYVPPQRTRGPADAFMPSPSKLAKAGDGLLPTPTALLPLPSSSSSSFVPPPNLLTTCACNTDEEIVDRLTAHLGSDSRADFIFTQLHTFEDHFASCARQSGGSAAGSGGPPPPGSFEKHLADIDQRVGRIYDALPPNGLLMVVTGRGPIVDVFRLQREKKDEGAAWTPERDRALQEAVEWARKGRTFWAVKPPSSDEATTTTTTAEKSE